MSTLLAELTPPVKSNSNSSGSETFLPIFVMAAIVIAVIVIIVLASRVGQKAFKKSNQNTQDDGFGDTVKEQKNTPPPQSQSSGGSCAGTFFKFILKLALIAGIVLFGLVNYRLLSFNKGWTKREVDDNMSMTEAVLTLTGISKVEYYDMAPFPFTSENYLVYIETSQKNYISKADQDDIDALNALGILSKTMRPQKITPIPFYVEIVLGIIVLAVPFGGRKKRQVVIEESD